MKRISPVRGGDAAVACPWPRLGGSGHSCRGRLWIRKDFLAASPCAVLERSEGSRGLWTGCVSRSHQAGPREDQGKRELAFLFWGGGGGKSPPTSTMALGCRPGPTLQCAPSSHLHSYLSGILSLSLLLGSLLPLSSHCPPFVARVQLYKTDPATSGSPMADHYPLVKVHISLSSLLLPCYSKNRAEITSFLANAALTFHKSVPDNRKGLYLTFCLVAFNGGTCFRCCLLMPQETRTFSLFSAGQDRPLPTAG